RHLRDHDHDREGGLLRYGADGLLHAESGRLLLHVATVRGLRRRSRSHWVGIPARAGRDLVCAMTDVIDKLDFDYPECLRADFGEHLPVAVAVVDDVLGWMTHVDFAPLARRSPGLRGFDWANYLRCSIARMVHVAAALERRHARVTRVLDYGSYFGNFALMLPRMGAEVDAVESYRAYE